MDGETGFGGGGGLVLRTAERMADYDTPMSLFRRMGDGDGAFLLESAPGREHVGQYSFFGRDPVARLVSWNGEAVVTAPGGATRRRHGTLSALRELLGELGGGPLPPIRFPGGAVGYFGYDVAREHEHFPNRPPDDRGLPDAHLVVPGLLYAYDHAARTLRATVAEPVGDDAGAAARRADARLEEALTLPERPFAEEAPSPPGAAGGPEEVTPGREAYLRAVGVAKEAILDGEIFQVVLSTRISRPLTVDPMDLYRALRRVNPSPYLFYLNLGGVRLVGSSPEALVTVRQGRVGVRPIAGTRPRGATAEEDRRIADELLHDEKERAEHVMLVDLGRNDAGRVSRPGSVAVKSLMEVETYSHVLHLVSQVEGELRPGADALSALAACFPAGTLTGAPKIRAMEIIDDLETAARGPYGGAVGYISLDGDLDTCIAIRTFVIHGSRVDVQAGAGIVADSVPEREWEECQGKAKALLKALEMTEGGL